ncbi:MAG TPA: lamin tail domain-containing protein [Candidatus Levybacteria bacterium]|nr:lamin tail domain-containing protein [Candidatus Levybacteria bacterium]
MRYAVVLAVLCIFGFISVSTASAQIKINEVFPNPSGPSNEPNEFIELFNTGDSEIDISGWILSDTQGSVTSFVIPNTILSGRSFISFRRSQTNITLNNTGDGIVLKNGEQIIDEISFENSTEDLSFGRYPDGTGDITGNMTPTENVANIEPPMPTPTNSATPTKTLTPTKTPMPTKIPTSTKIPTATKVSNVKESTIDTEKDVTATVLHDEVPENSSDSAVLGQYNTSGTWDTATGGSGNKPKSQTETLGATTTKTGSIAVIGGSLLLLSSCGILVFQKYRHIFFR